MTKILVVVDMQHDFVDGSLGSEAAQVIVPEVVNLIKQFSGRDDEVWATRDTHITEKDQAAWGIYPYDKSLEGKKLPVKHCMLGEEGWKIVPDVEEAIQSCENSRYFDKPTFGSLSMMEAMEQAISTAPDSGDEIHICGLCTDICVVSNALILRAARPNTRIVCHAKACAGTSKEAHEAALAVMRSCQIDVEE